MWEGVCPFSAKPRGTTIKPFVSIIIVNMNGRADLERCLPRCLKQTYPNYEVVVVDNDSTDGSAQYVAEHFPDGAIDRQWHEPGLYRWEQSGVRTKFKHLSG